MTLADVPVERAPRNAQLGCCHAAGAENAETFPVPSDRPGPLHPRGGKWRGSRDIQRAQSTDLLTGQTEGDGERRRCPHSGPGEGRRASLKPAHTRRVWGTGLEASSGELGLGGFAGQSQGKRLQEEPAASEGSPGPLPLAREWTPNHQTAKFQCNSLLKTTSLLDPHGF